VRNPFLDSTPTYAQTTNMGPPSRSINAPMPRNCSALTSAQSSTTLPTLNEPVAAASMPNSDFDFNQNLMNTFLNEDCVFPELDLTGTGVIGEAPGYNSGGGVWDPNSLPSDVLPSTFFEDQMFGGQGHYMNRDES
jgi:hypothetical protein